MKATTSRLPRQGIRRGGRNDRGLTLIEVVASLGIIGVGLVGLLALFPVGMDASARAGDRTSAAILGEYVVEQVRQLHDRIEPDHGSKDALEALGWDNYSYDGEQYTFIDPDDADYPSGTNFGSGEQIVQQYANPGTDLTDQELYSRYEVTLRFDEIEDNDGFTDGNNKYLMQVTITVRWPRASSNDARKKQNTMTFVTYIRPSIAP